jgi:hypothetical protein
MKTSASETQQIDRYLLQQLPPGDKLVFDARMMLCPGLKENVAWQQQVYQLTKLRGRQQLQAQIKAVEQKVFTQPEYSGFRQKLLRLFKG